MIFYFSGTGNTRHVAHAIGDIVGETTVSIGKTLPENMTPDGASLGFMFPVYAWGVPPIVIDFIRRLPSSFRKQAASGEYPVWCVMTAGDETGKAPGMFRNEAERLGFKVRGIWSVIMPNVYVLLPGFDVDPVKTEQEKLTAATARIEEIAHRISRKDWADDWHAGPMAGLKTRLVYPLFKRWGIRTTSWTVSDACVSCGQCSSNCPVGNISMVNGRPVWGDNCTSCCACYHACPTGALNYGSVTNGKGRYRTLISKD